MGSSGLSNILNPTYSARDEIYDIRCGTCNVASDLVGSAVAMAGESVPLLHMVLADYTCFCSFFVVVFPTLHYVLPFILFYLLLASPLLFLFIHLFYFYFFISFFFQLLYLPPFCNCIYILS